MEIYPGSTCTLLDNGIHHCKEGILIKVSSRQNVLVFQKLIVASINANNLLLGWLITLLPYGRTYISHMVMMVLVCLGLVHQGSILVISYLPERKCLLQCHLQKQIRKF